MMLLLIVCVLCASLTVSPILPLSGSPCCLIIKISLMLRPLKKNRPSVGTSAALVPARPRLTIMLYDTSSLMQCQVRKYSGLSFARKIRPVALDVSSKIWYCGTSIGLTYDGLIASANFCRNRFCPTCQWRRSVKLFRQNYECFEWIKAQHPGCRFIFLTLTVRNVSIDSLAPRLVDMSDAWHRFTMRRDFKALGLLGWLRVLISIHALLAESDRYLINTYHRIFGFLSTLSLRRAT